MFCTVFAITIITIYYVLKKRCESVIESNATIEYLNGRTVINNGKYHFMGGLSP